jgi:hypothetical protein
MAGLYGSFQTGAVSLTGGSAATVIQIVAPTNQRLRIISYEISFDGTNSANTPANVVIERQTGGTFTNTSVAPKKVNDPSGTGETLQAVAKTAQTVAPTDGDVLHNLTVPVFGGLFVYPLPPGQEDMVPGGTILGIKVNAPQTVNCYVTIRYEE